MKLVTGGLAEIMDITFKALFFRYYDRKIADGSITFSRLGISKSDFTKLCTEDGFVFDEETLVRICEVMQLTEDERAGLLEAARRK